MQSLALTFVLLIASPAAVLSAGANAGATSIAGVQKVIQMLEDMGAKCKEEKNKEQIAFAEFETWCKMEIPQTKNSIAKAAESIESLSAEIAKLTTEAKVLGEEIAKLQSDVASFESEKKAATAQREKDHAAYVDESTDYGESVDALERALVVLSKKDYDVAGTSAVLLQLAESDHLPAKARAIVASFLGVMGKDFMGSLDPLGGMDYEAPEAHAYDFQSSSIIAMLKKLRDEFREKLADCQKEEMNSVHAYDMVVQDLVDSIENSNETIEEKTMTKAKKEEKAAVDKKELASTIVTKKEDEKLLAKMEVECKEKQLSFTEKQQLRTEEIAAIQKAIEILKSPEVSANAEKHLELAQMSSQNAALAQLRGQESESAGSIHGHIRDFIAAEGVRLHSSQLSLLAQKIGADPFAKVKKMIDDMITRLLNEANEDAQHEGFCDKEFGKNKVTRNKLSEDIDGLQAAVEDGKATIMMLTEEIATLSKEVADLDSSMAEATKMRADEKATNKVTVEDAVAAQTAVTAATAVLKEFYEKASLATGLLQLGAARPKMGTAEWDSLANPNYKGPVDKGEKIGASWGHQEGMQTFGEKYTGQQDQAGGVMALLEVILSDFANLEAETKAAEAKSQESYESFMTESKKTKATKVKKIEMDTADKAAAEAKLQEDTKDLKGTQDELLAADRYYEKLVPQCIDQGMTWQERVAARQAEIASLKEALKILETR
jgi:uncharacterized protein YoxC